MLIQVKLPEGRTASIESAQVIRIRPSFGDYELQKTTFIDFVSSGVFSVESLDAIREKFAPHLRLASLSSPVDSPVLLNADGVAAIVPPSETLHHHRARSVAMFTAAFINPNNPARGQQQLRETEAVARARLNAAKVQA